MTAVAGSLIAAVAALSAAAITFIFNRNLQATGAWRTEKLSYYKELIDALSQNVEGMADEQTHRQFARASNNLLLIASQKVLEAHGLYREHIALSNSSSRDYSLDDGLLADLINAIRADLKMPGASEIEQGHARLWTWRKRSNSSQI